MRHFVCVDKDDYELIFYSNNEPYRDCNYLGADAWFIEEGLYCTLPHGSIQKLIGQSLTWEDEPVELK